MSSASRVGSRTANQVADVFDVHPRRALIDNRGMVGRSSIVKRVSAGSARGTGITLIVAAIFGAVALMHVVRTMSMRRGGAGGASPSNRLSALRRAILGVRKNRIAAVLGPPRATIGCGNHLTDDTWYYPINAKQQIALAIEFDDGVARQTQVIAGPRMASTTRGQ